MTRALVTANSSKSALCSAVRRVREAYGDTQQSFAVRVGLTLMTVSKFERGVRPPCDPAVLSDLACAATSIGLDREAELFRERARLRNRGSRYRVSASRLRAYVASLERNIPLLLDSKVSDEEKSRIGRELLTAARDI